MDERHWWFAKRISQTFGLDSGSTFLEKLICEPTNLEKINTFLCINGSNKLFVCGTEIHAVLEEPVSNSSDFNLLILEELMKAPKSLMQSLDNAIVLYFIRHDTIHEVSQSLIHKEVFCGEIRNVSQILFNIYNDLLFSLFASDQNWGLSNEVIKNQSLRNMEKYVNSISEFSSDSRNQKNMVNHLIESEFYISIYYLFFNIF